MDIKEALLKEVTELEELLKKEGLILEKNFSTFMVLSMLSTAKSSLIQIGRGETSRRETLSAGSLSEED